MTVSVNGLVKEPSSKPWLSVIVIVTLIVWSRSSSVGLYAGSVASVMSVSVVPS